MGYSSSLDYEILLDGDKYIAGNNEELRNKRLMGNHGRADWAWRWSKEKFEFGLENGFIEIKEVMEIKEYILRDIKMLI